MAKTSNSENLSYRECIALKRKWDNGVCLPLEKRKRLNVNNFLVFVLGWILTTGILVVLSLISLEIDKYIQSPLFGAVDASDLQWYHIFNPVAAPIMKDLGIWWTPTLIVCAIIGLLITACSMIKIDKE